MNRAIVALFLGIYASANGADIETMSVVASRTERFSEQRIDHLEIDEAEIVASGASDLAELLELVPGVRVVDGLRGKSLTMLGMSGRYVKLLINGNPINGRMSGEYDLTRIKLANVHRVEIIKGPSSSLHGSDAMGGVINIVTKWDESHSVIGTTMSTLGKKQGFAHWSHSTPVSSYRLAADASQSDSFTLEDSYGSFRAPKLSEAGVQFGLGIEQGAKHSLSAVGDFQKRSIKNVEARPTGAVFDRTNEITIGSLLLQDDIDVSDYSSLRLKAAISRYDDQYQNDQRGSNALDTSEDTMELDHSFALDGTHRYSSHELSFGIEKVFNHFKSDRLSDDQTYERDRQNMYVQNRWQGGDLTGTLGLRYEQDSQFGNHLSHKIAVAWAISSATKVSINESEGFRAPDFKELYMRFNNSSVGYQVEGNERLRPENSRYRSIELSHRQSSYKVLLRGFENRASNLISAELVPDNGSQDTQIFRYQNIGAARYQGLEVESDIMFSRWLSMALSQSYIEARNLKSDSYLSNRPLNATKLAILSNIQSDLRVNLFMSYYGKRLYYTQAGDVWEKSYTIARLAIDYDYNSALAIQGGINNFFNAGDSLYNPTEPLHAYAGIRYYL